MATINNYFFQKLTISYAIPTMLGGGAILFSFAIITGLGIYLGHQLGMCTLGLGLLITCSGASFVAALLLATSAILLLYNRLNSKKLFAGTPSA